MSQQEKVKYFDRVKSVRKALNLTQEQLGAKLGVSGNLIYKIEADTKPLVGRTLRDFLELESKLGLGQIDKDSVKAGVASDEPPAETRTIEQCRERIKYLEGELDRVWRMIDASRPHGISYGKRPTEAQIIGMQAGAADDLENPPPKK